MKQYLGTCLLSAMLLLSGLFTGCAGTRIQVGARYYDPGHADYHAWDDNEGVFYNQWTMETHRARKDFGKLKPVDQRAYWQWRHDHPDHR